MPKPFQDLTKKEIEEAGRRAAIASNRDQKLTILKAEFIRDVTKVHPMPKSEVKRRLEEILAGEEGLSQCPHCLCMTKAICGKCKKSKS